MCSVHYDDRDFSQRRYHGGLEMDSLYCHWGEQSRLQLFWLIVTGWQRQQGWAGLASDTEHQPSLLAHIQPSALISRYVLTIALMCSLFWRSFALPKPALFVRCSSSQPSLAFPLPGEQSSWNQLGYCRSPGMAAWLKAHTGYRIRLHMSLEMWRMWINSSLNQLLPIKHIEISEREREREKKVKQDIEDGKGRYSA